MITKIGMGWFSGALWNPFKLSLNRGGFTGGALRGVTRAATGLTKGLARTAQIAGDIGFGSRRRAMLLGLPMVATGLRMNNDSTFDAGINYVDPKNQMYRLKPGTLFNTYERTY